LLAAFQAVGTGKAYRWAAASRRNASKENVTIG